MPFVPYPFNSLQAAKILFDLRWKFDTIAHRNLKLFRALILKGDTLMAAKKKAAKKKAKKTPRKKGHYSGHRKR